MSFFTSLALAGLLCSLPVHCTRAAEDTFVFQGKQNTPYLHNSADSFVKGGYLVEYLDDGTKYSELSAALGGAGLSAKHRFDFEHKFFRGSSFVVDGTEDEETVISRIHSTKRAKKVWPLRRIKRDPGQIHSKLPNGAKLGYSKTAKRGYENPWSTHAMTGVDKLHAKGLTGKGTFIAILDTGVDYKHPDLGGGFGPGYKIAKGYDFVGDNAQFGKPKPDNDPYDPCGIHGTWVSGIVGANPGPLNAPGVAPDATLGMYRIFDCYLWTSEDIVISAYLKAFDDGADVISMSFGAYSGVHDDPLGQVVSHIVKSGVICVALSGEVGGPPFQANSPASAVGVLSVGTVENTVKPVFRFVGKYSNEKGESQSFEYEPTSLPLTGTRPLWTWDYKMDFKDPHSVKGCPAFPSGVKDLDKKVVLVPFCLGTMLDAIGKGAKHLLLHDRGENLQSLKPKNDDILSGLGAISRQQGDEWQKSFLKGVKATLSFTDPKKPEYRYREDPNSMGGSVHVLSSWGPTLELDPAPMLMAPGANVLSTLPEKDGSYGVLSRAGGAAPYAAGVAALLKQENKRITPKAVVDLLSTTANPINFHDGKSSDKTLAPPIQQGGGLISAHSALNIKTSVTPTNLKVKGRNHVSMVAIRNNESKWKRYSISHKPSHTVYTVFSELLKRGVLPETATGNAEASFPSEVNVPPKSTIEFAVHFKAPQKLDESRVPVYSGHILIKEKDGDELSIPYLGSPSKLQEIKPFNHGSTYLAASDNYGKQAAKGHVFKFPKDNTTKIDNFVQPVMMVGLDFYAREIQAEVIPESPIKGFDGTLGNHEPFGPFPPGLWIPIPVFGNLASGKKMPEGKFKLNVRGLKHGGEHHEENDWQKVTSSVFGIELVAGDKQ